MGQRIIIWQPVFLTNLRGICCYLVWFRENIFWAAVSHLRGFIVLQNIFGFDTNTINSAF